MSSFFDDNELNRIAKESGFIKRVRKLKPRAFLDIMLFGAYSKQVTSLLDHVLKLSIGHGISIRPQSLDEHLNEGAFKFLLALINKHLSSQLIDVFESKGFLDKWDRVILQDSTQFSLFEKLKKLFKGYGGNLKCDAVCKIQNTFDLKAGKIEALEIGDARLQDATSGKKTNKKCNKTDLLLRDLGYFDLQGFKEMSCDYVSKLKSKTIIFDIEGNRLDLKEIYNEMRKKKITFIDMDAVIGVKQRVPTRIIITLVPEDIKEERIRKTKKQNKSYGNKTSAEFRLYAGFNFYITNLSKEDFSAAKIMELYHIRWQIELMFKSWKSYFKLHESKDCQSYRVLCYIFSSLLFILINWEIASHYMRLAHEQNGKVSSVLKTMKSQALLKGSINMWLKGNFQRIVDDLINHFKGIAEYLVLERRKYSCNFADIIN